MEANQQISWKKYLKRSQIGGQIMRQNNLVGFLEMDLKYLVHFFYAGKKQKMKLNKFEILILVGQILCKKRCEIFLNYLEIWKLSTKFYRWRNPPVLVMPHTNWHWNPTLYHMPCLPMPHHFKADQTREWEVAQGRWIHLRICEPVDDEPHGPPQHLRVENDEAGMGDFWNWTFGIMWKFAKLCGIMWIYAMHFSIPKQHFPYFCLSGSGKYRKRETPLESGNSLCACVYELI